MQKVLDRLVERDAFGRATYEVNKYAATGMIEQIAKQADNNTEWVYDILMGMHKRGLIDLEACDSDENMLEISYIQIARSGIELYKMLQVT